MRVYDKHEGTYARNLLALVYGRDVTSHRTATKHDTRNAAPGYMIKELQN